MGIPVRWAAVRQAGVTGLSERELANLKETAPRLRQVVTGAAARARDAKGITYVKPALLQRCARRVDWSGVNQAGVGCGRTRNPVVVRE